MVHSVAQEGSDVPTELVARLEAASVGSRALDAVIFRAFGGPLPTEFADRGISLTWGADGKATMPLGDLQVAYTPPAYTTSLDAALALAERVLPGWWWTIDGPWPCRMKGGEMKTACTAEVFHSDGNGIQFGSYAETPALALCIAILKAVAAQSTTEQVGTEPQAKCTIQSINKD